VDRATETFTVEELDPDTDYCFAVRAIDDVDKMSDISNSACGTTGPFEYGTTLCEGWNTLSTPVKLASGANTLGDCVDPTLILQAYRWNGATQTWVPVFNTYALKPLEGLYVKVSAATIAHFLPSPDPSGPPTLQVYSKWNLVAVAPAIGANGALIEMEIWEALAGVDVTSTGNPGWVVAVSPPLCQEGWVVTSWTWMSPELVPCKAFFVYLMNQGTLPGYSTTPVLQ
jgi:hypothetical protein